MGNVRPGIFCHHFMTILMRWGGPFVTVNKVELTPCAIRKKKKRRRKGHSLYLLHLLSATKGQPELDLVRILFFLVQLLARRKYSTSLVHWRGKGVA